MGLKYSNAAVATLVALFAGSFANAESPLRILETDVPDGYALVWSDEFKEDGLPDGSKWSYDTHANKNGWYNNELQYYADARLKNSRVEDGKLIIEAHAEELNTEEFEDWGGQKYTSARLYTVDKQTWTYGYFEIKAKLPCEYGSWPAIWTLGTREGVGWPAIGEIDIMEYASPEPGIIHGTVHTRDYNHSIGTHRGSQIEADGVCDSFHVYQLHWTPERIKVGMDGDYYFEVENDGTGFGSWPFDDPHYLILNVAIGGWGGEADKIDVSDYPVRMEVDYVRVYQPKN